MGQRASAVAALYSSRRSSLLGQRSSAAVHQTCSAKLCKSSRPRAVPRLSPCPSPPCRPPCSLSGAFHDVAVHLTTRLFLLGDAAEALVDAAASPAVADAAEAAKAAKSGGFFGAFASAFEQFLKVLDDGLEKAGVPYR